MSAKKRILSIGLAASLAAVAIAGSSLAYFTDSEEADNTYTIGNVDIVLTEPHWNEGQDLGGFEVEADDLYPGEAVAKDPTVKNEGKNPAFVRVKVDGLENFTYRTDYVEGKLGDGWVAYDDGYFYYDGVLEVDATTDALFDQVVLNTNVGNGNGETGHIMVYAEAVQAQGAKTKWADVQNMKVSEIAAWFATCRA